MPTKILLVYYLIINVVLFILMGIDKARAKKDKWRVPESTLFIVSFLGGAIGGLAAMRVFHHKTRKPSFLIIYIISLILHCALVSLLFKNNYI